MSCWNHPFEVARIQMQSAAAEGLPKQNMLQVFKTITVNEGIGGLFKVSTCFHQMSKVKKCSVFSFSYCCCRELFQGVSSESGRLCLWCRGPRSSKSTSRGRKSVNYLISEMACRCMCMIIISLFPIPGRHLILHCIVELA